jgi:hypothetical protein
MPDEKLSQSIQESITTAVGFVNDDNSQVIANLIEPVFFDEPLNLIVDRSVDYRKTYKRPPGKQHIDDLFTDILYDRTHKFYTALNRLLDGMIRQADGLNTRFVLDRVADYVRLRKVRLGMMEAAERYNKGGENVIDDLESIFRQILRIKDQHKDYGFNLSDQRALGFLDRAESNDFIKIGIDPLDEHGVHPARKELLLFIAPRNRGKSQFLNHCAKMAYLQGWRAIYYTLENSAEMTSMRLFQTLFSGVRRAKEDDKFNRTPYSYVEFTGDGANRSFRTVDLKPDFIITDKDAKRFLEKKVNENHYQLENIRIRSFPTGRLSYNDLEKDLDDLAILERFIPDIILLDMPQLMRMNNTKQGWESLEELTVELRGLAVDRNLALIAPQQGNRASESASTVQSYHGSGSISMFGIADNAITYSQTPSEEEHGMARLYAAKVRNDAARFTVLITQHYPTGQFCMDSKLMTKDLQKEVKDFIGGKDDIDADIDAEEDYYSNTKKVKKRADT